MPLLQNEKINTNPYYFKYTKGKIHLVLIQSENKPKWMYRQDLKDDTPILRSKIYTFGDRYGILSKKDEDMYCKLNIRGIEWHLRTLPDGSPILKDIRLRKSSKGNLNYILLEEVY